VSLDLLWGIPTTRSAGRLLERIPLQKRNSRSWKKACRYTQESTLRIPQSILRLHEFGDSRRSHSMPGCHRPDRAQIALLFIECLQLTKWGSRRNCFSRVQRFRRMPAARSGSEPRPRLDDVTLSCGYSSANSSTDSGFFRPQPDRLCRESDTAHESRSDPGFVPSLGARGYIRATFNSCLHLRSVCWPLVWTGCVSPGT